MKQLRITVDGKAYTVTVEKLDSTGAASPAPASAAAPAPAPTPVQSAPAAPVAPAPPPAPVAANQVPSPLAGVVKSLDVAVGTHVKAGDLVLTLEAMKMFTAMNAPSDGTVTAFHVAVGQAVDEGAPLYSLG
jgi:biotin carboxyl carrier protein